MRLILLACLILLAPVNARAAWGSFGCGPVGPSVVHFQPPAANCTNLLEGWIRFDATHQHLYRRGVHVAGWDETASIYRTYDAATNTWSEPLPAPWAAGELPPWKTKGVEWKGGGPESYAIDGRPVPREAAFQAIADGTLVDDSGKLRLTVIGPLADRQPVLQDLAAAPQLAPFREAFLVQGYEPADWAVSRYGFVTSGRPTIYVQKADGTVLHRSDVYEGPDALAVALGDTLQRAQAVGAIRRPDPNYRPDLDPDLTQPPLLPTSWVEAAIGILLACATPCLGFLFSRR